MLSRLTLDLSFLFKGRPHNCSPSITQLKQPGLNWVLVPFGLLASVVLDLLSRLAIYCQYLLCPVKVFEPVAGLDPTQVEILVNQSVETRSAPARQPALVAESESLQLFFVVLLDCYSGVSLCQFLHLSPSHLVEL